MNPFRSIGYAIIARAIRRSPDFVIGGEDDPYLMRWWLIPRNRWFNVYLHLFLRSDDDRALHDHPWASCSLLIEGRYTEIVPQSRGWFAGLDAMMGVVEAIERRPGRPVFRGASAAHRLELHRDAQGREKPVWSLFITGPKVREWGFWCPKGWRHWREFCAVDEDGSNSGRVGRGCE